ncbi:Cytochrome P450 - like 10 [Theobroma cacao]|nr:Cytochrome P450 - like 10 [Theobroma cacao]
MDMQEVFLPERFENLTVDFKGQNFEFILFGVGKRICPGMLFGVVVVEYVIANLLYWFNWKLPDDMVAENLDMTEAFGLVVSMKFPLRLCPLLHLEGRGSTVQGFPHWTPKTTHRGFDGWGCPLGQASTMIEVVLPSALRDSTGCLSNKK